MSDSVYIVGHEERHAEDSLDMLMRHDDPTGLGEYERQRIIYMQALYDTILSENEIALEVKSNEIDSLGKEKQGLIRLFLFLTSLMVLVFFVMLYSRLRIISRIKHELERQQEDIINKNRQLTDLLMMRDKLFSIISHDLRNPFASVVSFSRILRRDIDDLSKKELVELAGELDSSVNRINHLLDNLLQWSRAQSGQIRFSPDAIFISDIVQESIDIFLPLAREKQIDLFDETPPELTAWADATITDIIVRNLLSNALKFTESGGEVRITAKKGDGEIIVSVSDNGMGISVEDQRALFRFDNVIISTGTHGERGSGLGLMICKEFADKQGGRLWFTSEPGKGSVFFFSLPLGD